MKVSELTGALLDYLVAKAEGMDAHIVTATHGAQWVILADTHNESFEPSTDWAQGGPIIESERIDIIASGNEWDAGRNSRIESSGEEQSFIEWIEMDGKQSGPTPLIAAMRAYVALKFGDEVPDEPSE